MPRRTKTPRTRQSAPSGVGIGELLEAKRRYKNARKRARFWSGTLTFNFHLRSNETRSSRLAEKYELAMCDCKVWEQTIEELTGKPVKHYDPKAEFAARWSKLKFASNADFRDAATDAMAAFSARIGSVSGRTHLDLFSGIGGFALAAQRTGWQTIAFSEIETYACKILAQKFPGVPNLGDIRNVRGVCADLVTGGFPCQPYSTAGKRAGASDDRALWPEMLRVIGEARPAWVLGENVPGIVSMELDRVLDDLENLGYAAWPLAIPACAVDARHRRERIWIVAHSASRGTLPIQQRGQWNGSKPNGETLADAERITAGARRPIRSQARTETAICGENVADADETGRREQRRAESVASQHAAAECGGEDVSDDGCRGSQGSRREIGGESKPARWQPEPGMGRVVDGIPNRSHRLRGLGNAIVPQVAEVLMREMARTLNADFRRGDLNAPNNPQSDPPSPARNG